MSEQDRYTKKLNARIAAILKDLIKAEQEARARHGIKDAFKYIPAQLKELWDRLERELPYDTEEDSAIESGVSMKKLQPNQVAVYIYLYHAQGQKLESWLNMLTPKALSELAISRPTYAQQADVEAFLKNKVHQPIYAYLIAHVNTQDILEPLPKFTLDQNGRPLVRLKEGALKPENIAGLHHNTLGLFAYLNGELKKIAQ